MLGSFRSSAGIVLCVLACGPASAQTTFETETKAPEETTEETDRSRSVVQLPDVVVEATRPLSAASSKDIRIGDLELRPHSTTQEMLEAIPGLLAVQHQGGGKAIQYFMRGFDSDHGTDILLLADGLPVNMVTHGHGQGYADINFIIPETVSHIELYKGPYFAQFGDFATSGAVRFNTLDEFPQNFALAEGGSFDTARVVLGASPKLEWENAKTLLAAQVYHSNGYFDDPQHYWNYSVLGKLTLEPSPDHELEMSVQAYGADWDASGQLPLYAVQSGEIDRFGSLDPTEGGKTDRQIMMVRYAYRPNPEDLLEVFGWGQHYKLDLFSNFTYFRDTGLRFIGLPDGGFVDTCAGWTPENPVCAPLDPNANYIPGDGIEQTDERWNFGGTAVYSHPGEIYGVPYFGQAGLYLRGDLPDVSLLRQVRRKAFFTINGVSVGEYSTGGFLQADFFPTDWLRVNLGLRGDAFVFDVDDRLPMQAPDRNFEAVPISGNVTDGLPSPKASFIFSPWQEDPTELYLNFGMGFHSNDARAVVLTGVDGLVRATGGEGGVRTRLLDRINIATALWVLDLDSELVFSGDGGNVDADFDPVAGNFVAGSASRRWGMDFETQVTLAQGLTLEGNVSWADPKFDNGDAIPLAPTLYADGGLNYRIGGFGAAVRFRYLADRPANEDDSLTATGFALIDVLFRYRWRNVEASLTFLNVGGESWRETQFAESTCTRNTEGSAACPVSGSLPNQMEFAEGIEDITFIAGHPFSVRGGIQVWF